MGHRSRARRELVVRRARREPGDFRHRGDRGSWTGQGGGVRRDREPRRKSSHTRDHDVPGRLDVLVTAWNDNIATRDSVAGSAAAVLLQPAPSRFAFGRLSSLVSTTGSAELGVKPDARGLELARHPHYPVRLRVWVTYTPVGGTSQTVGYYGLRIGGRCSTVTSTVGRLKAHCV